jgi:hypothetical protein
MNASDLKSAKKLEFIKFVYTFILGGTITFFWQFLNNYFSREADQVKYEKTQATDLFTENSKLLGKVVISFRSFARGMDKNLTWRQAYIYWEENFTKNKALTEEYFGKTSASDLVTINDSINSLSDEFLDSSSSKNDSAGGLETEVNNLDNNIYDLNSILIKALLSDKIGSNKE